MSDFVLDASVSLAWYLPATSAQDAYAGKVMTLIRNGAIPAVPSLWIHEMGARLIKAQRSKLITLAALNKSVSELEAIPYDTHHIAYSVGMLVKAAKGYHLQGYDAVYFDLAKRLGIPIASVDRGIRSACKRFALPLL